MRIRILITALAVSLAGHTAIAAPAMMNPPGQYAGQGQQQPAKRGFWGFLGLGKKSPAPQPVMSTALGSLRPEPSRSSRFWGALKSNPVGAAFAGNPKQAVKKPDVLSLQTPTGGPSPKSCLVLARVAEQAGDIPAARRHLGQALAIDPKSVATLREIAHLEDRQQRLNVAEQMYRRAVAAAPQDAAVQNDLALCCARQGKLAESVSLLSNAIALEPKKTLYRNNVAKVLVEMGQGQAAMAHLLTVHPAGVAHYNLGSLLASKGDSATAAQCFQQALASNPKLTVARDALAALAPKAPVDSAVQVASAPRTSLIDPSPAGESDITPIEQGGVQEESQADDLDAPVLLPPVR